MHTKVTKKATKKATTTKRKVAKKVLASVEVPVSATAAVTWYTAAWCGPCQAVKKEYMKMSPEDKALFEIVDVDADPVRTSKAGVRSMPTFIRDDGKVLHGAQTGKSLLAWAKKEK